MAAPRVRTLRPMVAPWGSLRKCVTIRILACTSQVLFSSPIMQSASPEIVLPGQNLHSLPVDVTLVRARPGGDFFSTAHLRDGLKGRSVRGGAASLVGQVAYFLMRLGSMAVLARILTPGDFGLVAMATAITGFVEMFKDAGLSLATVQRAEITHAQVSILFWINVALSAGLMLLVAAIAPAVAWFYGDSRLIAITLVVAGAFLFGGVGIQHAALLRRQMRFGTLATVQFLS
ncbi:MAG: oligosaccharide flippase family protein, partial [Thermoguttaceae bacterium]